MIRPINRREFLMHAGAAGLAAGVAGVTLAAEGQGADGKAGAVADHSLTTIAGPPRERGVQYGRTFKDSISSFLDKEIYQSFQKVSGNTKDAMLGYAAGCAAAVQGYAPLVFDELQGMAEGSGLKLEELVLITLHEELWHRGVLPAAQAHCTAVAAGPPDTKDGNSYVGQTWDWMPSVYGLSSMLLWKRPADEGPSVLAYSYPGLWVGAGMNSAGVALCWTSGPDEGSPGPRVGIPSYVLIAQMLYQPTLAAAVEEARRATHAGWFTFVMGDGEGNLANVEGSPKEGAVETARGHLARVYFGSRKMTAAKEGEPVKYHPRCQRMYEMLSGAKGKLDRAAIQGFFGAHAEEGNEAVCVHPNTLDAMLFDCTNRHAYVARGPACTGKWRRFGFEA
jgi:isopenicillin-N N-acyltransferase-like protein